MGVFRQIHSRLVARGGADQGAAQRSGRAAEQPRLGERAAARVLFRVATGAIRGQALRLRARASTGVVLVGRRVEVLDAGYLSLGRGVKIEDLAEVQCRSARGVRLGDGVTIGRNASIRPSSYYGVDEGEGLSVGSGSAIGALSWIGASGFVDIGRDVMLGPRVTILPENHVFADVERPIKDQGVERLGVTIEDDCWIGAGATILAGVRVGTGSIVAAGAVVTSDVAPRSIVGGVPARLIRQRTQEHGPRANGHEASATAKPSYAPVAGAPLPQRAVRASHPEVSLAQGVPPRDPGETNPITA